MSWFKKSLSCFRPDRPNRCDCHRTIVGSKPGLKLCNKTVKQSDVSDKNIQCDFEEDFSGEHFRNCECDNNNKSVGTSQILFK